MLPRPLKILEVFQSTLPVWGATLPSRSRRKKAAYFNPRSPCGERLRMVRHRQPLVVISIHAPRVGSD